jgi:tRNA nucleotidyltransferase/poly(A) polymerase
MEVFRMNFKVFLENEEERFESLSVEIPLPNEVRVLAHLFKEAGQSLFVVGGAVRDKLYKDLHLPGTSYKPKDVDLATAAQPEAVVKILSSEEAKKAGVSVFPKGISFGVISAMLNGHEFEIATFREDWYDPESGDGRRPDKVAYSTPAKDAKRRDLTVNALFYDINDKEVRDYNLDEEGRGMGIQDIKNKVARPVGNPRDRFREDRLRIPRLVRFFCRFNDGDILKALDEKTLEAVWEFRALPGVSGERIAMEFMAGLKQSLKPAMFLRNYESLGLFPATFPNLHVDVKDFASVKDVRNPNAVIAWILKSNGDPKKVKTALTKQKYPGTVFEVVEFLLHLYELNPERLAALLRQRDLYKQELDMGVQQKKAQAMRGDVMDFAKIAGMEARMVKFLDYSPVVKSSEFMHLEPAQRGKAMSQAERDNYFRNNEQ